MSERWSEGSSASSSHRPHGHDSHRTSRKESLAPHSDSLGSVHRRRTSRLSIIGGPKMDVFRRLSIASGTDVLDAPKEAKRPNTYRLGPEANEKFNNSETERLIAETLESYLDGETYDRHKCVGFAKNLSEVIKARVRDNMSPRLYRDGLMTRYKIVCHVLLGQDTGQTMRCASRCLLNTDMDGFASATYSQGDLFAVAAVYALYTD